MDFARNPCLYIPAAGLLANPTMVGRRVQPADEPATLLFKEDSHDQIENDSVRDHYRIQPDERVDSR